MPDKKIVITGATGFIGLTLVHRFLKDNYRVVAIVRPKSKHINCLPENDRLQKIELELTDLPALPSIIGEADGFLHFAWEGTRGAARNNAALQQENVNLGVLAAKTAVKLHCSMFIGCGSQAEYGNQRDWITELTKPLPQTEYGRAKCDSFEHCRTILEKAGMRFVWPRVFSVYGPGDYSGTLVMSALEKMRRGEDVLVTKCTQNWDFLYVEDAAEAIVHLAEDSATEGTFNLASGDVRPLRSFLEEMRLVTGTSSEIRYGAIPCAADTLIGFQPNTAKIMGTGWKPAVNFAQGIHILYSQTKGNQWDGRK